MTGADEKLAGEPTEEMIAKGAHVLSEWLDDAAPLHERRYREPARAAFKAMLALSPPASEADPFAGTTFETRAERAEREAVGEAVERGPNASYPWQVYAPADPHGGYDIGGPSSDGGFPCIATVFGGKVDADYIVSLHNAALAAKPDEAMALLREALEELVHVTAEALDPIPALKKGRLALAGKQDNGANEDRLTKQLGLALVALEVIADGDGPPQDIAQQTLDDITRVGMEAIGLTRIDQALADTRREG